ncbi:hypothetical protein FUT79_05095 [Treponema phagedenis]|uniref:adenine-specific methyltransferase EcoRI family protein n=1 Tax=Treponema phagedenis TaxID=162 RepID=UPI0011E6A915|nr:adenine-specific methyltransferase EcoRI family protein [Treponema phagedenis]QEJ94638.1 hypothetical protein FUT79_05095 [Treponema phagedenis]
MANNKALHAANRAKNDEFYTQLSDIENELRHYVEHFKGKIIYCNCDDPRISNFFKYFYLNFEHFGLKSLITTCYKNQDIDLFSQNAAEKAVWIEYKGGGNINNFDNIEVKKLQGDGDFRSSECVELLKKADIVITNPPFSLFREYVAQLVEYKKKFVIIGNKNAITYKEIFPLIAGNKLWMGVMPMGFDILFDVPQEKQAELLEGKPGSKYKIVNGVVKARSTGCWFTNLDHKKRHEELVLYRNYSPEVYPTYDNYDAINVDKVADIPCDYYGVMGVPITFLDKYNPEQFEIVAFRKGNDGKDLIYSLTRNEGEVREEKRREEKRREEKRREEKRREDSLTSGYSYNELRNQFSGNDRATVSGKLVYARIFIRRVCYSNSGND